MTTVPDGAVDDDIAGLWTQHLENFGDHDGDVGAGRRATLGPHVFVDVRIRIGVEFLVALLELFGVRTDVPGPTLGPRRLIVTVVTVRGAWFHRCGIVLNVSGLRCGEPRFMLPVWSHSAVCAALNGVGGVIPVRCSARAEARGSLQSWANR